MQAAPECETHLDFTALKIIKKGASCFREHTVIQNFRQRLTGDFRLPFLDDSNDRSDEL